MDTPEVAARITALPKPPATVTAFLGRLTLLHGVPFAYLVPDGKLLPPDSLKCFSLDGEWINALVGGALSVGPTAVILPLLNKTLAGESYVADILAEARALRARARGAAAPDEAANPGGVFGGFLLRSRILQAWPGLQVKAFGPTGERAMVRLDRIAPDTLLALVDGLPDRLEISQPPEGLHFVAHDAPPLRDAAAARVIDVATWAGAADGGAAFAARQVARPLRLTIKLTD